MSTTSGWQRWLNNHPSAPVYNSRPDRIKAMVAHSPARNFKSLSETNNLVLLTKAQMGGKVQASFYHSTVGLPITPELCHHTARIGMNTGTGMEVDATSLFQVSAAIHKPDLVDMMKIKST